MLPASVNTESACACLAPVLSRSHLVQSLCKPDNILHARSAVVGFPCLGPLASLRVAAPCSNTATPRASLLAWALSRASPSPSA